MAGGSQGNNGNSQILNQENSMNGKKEMDKSSKARTGLSEHTKSILLATAPVVKEHGTEITTTMYRIMTTNHPEVKNLFNTSHLRPGKGREPAPQARSLANAVFAFAHNCDKLENLTESVGRMVHKHVSFMIMPEHYPIVGESILMAIKEVLKDAATEEIIQGWAEGYEFLANLLIDAETKMREEYLSKPGGWCTYRGMTVVKKVIECSDVCSFYLTPPNGEPIMDFLPGQYLSFRIPKEQIPEAAHDYVRNYSISSRPGLNQYRITVKREAEPNCPMGKISSYFHENIREGDEVLVGPPCGMFTLNSSKKNPVVLLSGGIGVTPMISMLDHLKETQSNRRVIFVHSTKDKERHPFASHVDNAAVDNSIESHIVYTEDGAKAPDDLQNVASFSVGRLTSGKLKVIMGEDLLTAEYYFCGPPAFITGIQTALELLGVPEEATHHEFFGPTTTVTRKASIFTVK